MKHSKKKKRLRISQWKTPTSELDRNKGEKKQNKYKITRRYMVRWQ